MKLAGWKIKGPAEGAAFLIACILVSAWVGWSLGVILVHVLLVVGARS